MKKQKGLRFNAGKQTYHLLPKSVYRAANRVMEMGAKKYAPRNWQNGGDMFTYSQLLNCIYRHLERMENGEDIDPESGQPHAAHVLCNLEFIEWYRRNKPEFDDRKEWF